MSGKTGIHETIEELEKSGGNTGFSRLLSICRTFFGNPRGRGTNAHCYFKTGLSNNLRLNLQPVEDGKALHYQVRQVINALYELLGNG